MTAQHPEPTQPGHTASGTSEGTQDGAPNGLPGIPDAADFDAAQAAAQVGEGGRLMQSFVRQDQDPSVEHDLAVVSDFFGTKLLVPVVPGTQHAQRPTPATFSADGERVLGVSLREQDATHLHRTIAEAEGRADDALGDPTLVEMFGDEAIALAFAESSFEGKAADAIVVDPLGLGIAVKRDDQLLEYPLRSGALRHAVHQGRDAVLAYLMQPQARAVYMHRGDGKPLLLRRPSDGAQVFPLFSSALEVFRFNPDVATAELDGPWLRAAVPAGMHLVVDVKGGDTIEFSPADLDAAGFRTA